MQIDIRHGAHCDVLNIVVISVLRGWIRSHVAIAVWVATPCASWSRARHDLPDKGGPRSKEFIMGKPNLSEADCRRVDIGNRTMDFSARLISFCRRFNTPVVLENPWNDYLWLAAPIARQVSGQNATVVDFCQYGEK